MIKIAIVEDEVMYAQQLQDFLHQYEKENGELFDITVYTDGDQIVHKYQSQYDLILMDVEMKFMDGMPDIRITVSENGYIQINGKRAYPLSLKYAGKRLYVHLLGCLQDGADLQQ